MKNNQTKPSRLKLGALIFLACGGFIFLLLEIFRFHHMASIYITIIFTACVMPLWLVARLSADEAEEAAEAAEDDAAEALISVEQNCTVVPSPVSPNTRLGIAVFLTILLVAAVFEIWRSPIFLLHDMSLEAFVTLLFLAFFGSLGLYLIVDSIRNRNVRDVRKYARRLSQRYKMVITSELTIEKYKFGVRCGIFLMVLPVVGLYLDFSMKLEQFLIILYYVIEEYFIWPRQIRAARARTATPQ